jgi:cytoskeletal protein CcmA (bactofilin family)
MNGNINCARLVSQDGARFNGKVVMEKQSPLKIAPKPETLDYSYTDSGKNKSECNLTHMLAGQKTIRCPSREIWAIPY